MARIKINNKRIHNTTDKAIVILTSTYGGKFVSIPKKFITEKKKCIFKVNDNHTEEGIVLTINQWIFGKIEEKLNEMHEYNYKLLNR